MKSIFQSKINWLAVLIAVVGILQLPEFTAVIPAKAMPFVLLAIAIGLFILRTFFTGQPVTQFAADHAQQ